MYNSRSCHSNLKISGSFPSSRKREVWILILKVISGDKRTTQGLFWTFQVLPPLRVNAQLELEYSWLLLGTYVKLKVIPLLSRAIRSFPLLRWTRSWKNEYCLSWDSLCLVSSSFSCNRYEQIVICLISARHWRLKDARCCAADHIPPLSRIDTEPKQMASLNL